MGIQMLVMRCTCMRQGLIACSAHRVARREEAPRDTCRSVGTTQVFRSGSVKMVIVCSLIVGCRWCRRTRMVNRMCMSGSVKGPVLARMVLACMGVGGSCYVAERARLIRG